MSVSPIIVWFRQDLRINDNAALSAAAATGLPVLPVYILDDDGPGAWKMGGASRWWLHHSLVALGSSLACLGAPLLLRHGASARTLCALARETGARAVLWNRCAEPYWQDQEAILRTQLAEAGIDSASFPGALLFDPDLVRSREGNPIKVFTPFWKACLAAAQPAVPTPAPTVLRGLEVLPPGDALVDWRLLPTAPDWAGGLRTSWQPGEAGAQHRFETFLDRRLGAYGRLRNRPEPAATSQLSPHLHFGEISPRQVWHAVRLRMEMEPAACSGGESFLRELGWREFCQHVLIDQPEMPVLPLQRRFEKFAWVDDPAGLRAWQRGQTGYPIVDAGMRQLWQTGWMHNRVRMIVASFLVKDLLLPWQIGQQWFWDTLVDADLANNAGGWQWVAGCGTDAAPYFRIFNPVLQGEKFDPEGAYVRRWVPEIANLPNAWIHRPWQAPPLIAAEAGIRIGSTYPCPLVDHFEARKRALAAFSRVTQPG